MKRYVVIDVFRGLFSILVVLFHMSVYSDTPILNNKFISNSDLFVDFFFVLSGFVIAHNYSFLDGFKDLKKFFLNRFYRLYPLHFVLLIAFLFLEIIKHLLASKFQFNESMMADNNLTTFFTSLFLLNSIKILEVSDLSWNAPSWSISAEIISYICFGLLTYLLTHFKIVKFKMLFYLLIIISAIIALNSLTNSFSLIRNYDYGFLRGLIGFFTGVICVNVFNNTMHYFDNIKKAWFTLVEAVMLTIIFFMIWNADIIKPIGIVFDLLFFVAIYLFAMEGGAVSDLLKKSSLLKNLGRYSYSIYMTHVLILILFKTIFIRMLKLPPSSYSYLFIINLLVIYIVSAFTYKHIEMRFSKKKRRFEN